MIELSKDILVIVISKEGERVSYRLLAGSMDAASAVNSILGRTSRLKGTQENFAILNFLSKSNGFSKARSAEAGEVVSYQIVDRA